MTMRPNRAGQVNVALPADVRRRIRDEAHKRDETIQDFVARALRHYFEWLDEEATIHGKAG